MTNRNMTVLMSALFLLLTVGLSMGDTAADLADAKKTWRIKKLPAVSDKERDPLKGKNYNVSGIALSGDRKLMVVASDEGYGVQILRHKDGGKYELVDDYSLAKGSGTELDAEGVARDGKRFWLIGSHSLKRKSLDKVEVLKKQGENHERMQTVVPEPPREWVYVMTIGDDGKVDKDSIARGSLRTIFTNHPVLSRFRDIPSKENGIDIEGLAVIPDTSDEDKAELLVGLRGPVLRGPRAVVLVVKAKRKGHALKLKLKKNGTKYLALGGRGIRGISRMDRSGKDFLVLAGPVGDAPVSYMVYFWNGKDTIPEIDKPDAEDNVTPLCEIPEPYGTTGAKAEGIQVLKVDDGKVRFLVVYDTAKDGGATEFECGLN